MSKSNPGLPNRMGKDVLCFMGSDDEQLRYPNSKIHLRVKGHLISHEWGNGIGSLLQLLADY